MKFDEFKQLVKGMKSIYTVPNFLPDKESVVLWYKLLKDLSYESANISIQKYAMTNKFPPTIADIREGALISNKEMWSDAWENVLSAIKRYGTYQEIKALSELDDTTRKVVKCLGWRSLCLTNQLAVERANFRMIYESLSAKKKEERQLSKELKELMSTIKQIDQLEV